MSSQLHPPERDTLVSFWGITNNVFKRHQGCRTRYSHTSDLSPGRGDMVLCHTSSGQAQLLIWNRTLPKRQAPPLAMSGPGRDRLKNPTGDNKEMQLSDRHSGRFLVE